jgi:hypothetical protein
MKSLNQLAADLLAARKGMTALADNLPRIIGVESVKIVQQNFQIEGYDSGNGITKWDQRKVATNLAYGGNFTYGLHRIKNSKRAKRYKGSVYSASKPLLRQTLALYNSIAYKASRRRVFIGTNLNAVPDAQAHNEGLNHEPKRQYMPLPNQRGNPKIFKVVGKRIDYETAKVMRAFKR